MVTIKEMRLLALSFAETEELPYFGKASFRIQKRIFATLDEEKTRATLKLTHADQSLFLKVISKAFYPVPNNLGKQGWTMVNLRRVRKDIFKNALTTAYYHVALKSVRT